MFGKTLGLFDVFDLGDLSFFVLLAKKNLKHLILASALVSLIVLFISLNMEKKYLSEATLVISPDENKIINSEIDIIGWFLEMPDKSFKFSQYFPSLFIKKMHPNIPKFITT